MARPAIVGPKPLGLPEHELLARIFRALGDRTRLRMLDLLLEAGELTQSELVARAEVPQPRASEHLRCLVWCGFVAAERRGRAVRYRVRDPRAERFVRLAREFVSVNQEALGSCAMLRLLSERDLKIS